MHETSVITSILFILVAALSTAILLFRFRQPTLIGFILGGILVGPYGFALVPYEEVELLAEIGVGLIMFTIGLELSIQKLIRVKYVSILGGGLHVALTVGTVILIGKYLNLNLLQSFAIGCAIALSSTAVVLKLLAERGEVGSTHGNVSTGTLLFQDIIAVPMLIFIPLLAKGEAFDQSFIFSLIGQFTIYIVVLYASARILVPKFLKIVTKTQSKELFSISIMCVCLGIAGISQHVGLSLALGAFLAGLIVSESDFGSQATSEILPLKDAFGAIFFASIGMLLNPSFFLESWKIILIGVPLIIFGKFFIFFIVTLLFRYPVKTSIFTALGLAQVGEFSLLLLMTAHKNTLISTDIYQLLLGQAILSIILTPYLLKIAPFVTQKLNFLEHTQWISRGLQRDTPSIQSADLPEGLAEADAEIRTGHVVLCGYGPTGSIVMKKLVGSGLPVVVIDLNYKVIQSLKAENINAMYGEASSTAVLHAAGIDHAELLVVTIPDPIAMRSVVKKVKQMKPELPIMVRVKYQSDKEKLVTLGADEVVWEEHESGQELSKRVLNYLRITPENPLEENS